MNSIVFPFPASEGLTASFHDCLNAELDWCQKCLQVSMKCRSQALSEYNNSVDLPLPPQLLPCRYGDFVTALELDFRQRLALIMALVPLLRPQLFDVFLQINEMTQRPYTEFGCVEQNGVVWATGHTLVFVLGESHAQEAWSILALLRPSDADNTGLASLLEAPDPDFPAGLWRVLRLKPSVSHECLMNQSYEPEKDYSFAARRVDTSLSWDQVIHSCRVRNQLEDMLLWLEHGEKLRQQWGMSERIRPGFRALFHGPPGTGKTLTASLIGNQVERPVYRVDIALVMSKYIGETEKNLEEVFALAEKNHWILFFDEADALFGQRVQTSGANDQFANQSVSYLLQRIEQFSGIIILATNLRDNMDEAFFRRFESVVHFALPEQQERLYLWQQAIPGPARLSPEVNLQRLAQDHPLSGADIHNIVRYAALKALGRGDDSLRLQDLHTGIDNCLTTHKTVRGR